MVFATVTSVTFQELRGPDSVTDTPAQPRRQGADSGALLRPRPR